MILKTLANDAVNFKGSRILKNKYRIKSSFSCHSSHISAGTIRRTCTSVNHSKDDAKLLHENLKNILIKDFVMSTKSMEMLQNALNNLEMNQIYLHKWRFMRMTGFLDACIWTTSILEPFLDTIISGNIHPD